jgi:hypothetical protein
MEKLCIRCNGNGKYLGNGMMMTNCELCENTRNNDSIKAPELDKIDRRSKDYRDAINDIMKESNLSRKEATQIFEEAYVRT